MEGVGSVLKWNELNTRVKKRPYQKSMRGKYEVLSGGDVKSVEQRKEIFRDILMECTNDVCGTRRVGRQSRMGGVKTLV